MSETLEQQANESARHFRLGLSGLHCGGCAMRVKETLMKLPEVLNVEVSSERDSCLIELRGEPADPQHFVRSVEEIGFGAHLLN
ncbi:heavy-metal-associated domain-containing protein [bacterium]|nr:heavy-metal-associated domain-containing protein [bacterium]